MSVRFRSRHFVSTYAHIDYLAESVDAFLTETNQKTPENESGNDLADAEYLSLGLTFSFPVEQSALDSGILLTWTKGFAAKNAITKDVVKLLQDAFDRKHIHVKCVALVNDVSICFHSAAKRISEPSAKTDRRCPSITCIYIWRLLPR